MADCYHVASVRHLIDADLLYAQHRLDNAMCHYAFSAECALKCILNAFVSKAPITHNLDLLQDLVCAYTELLGLLHPKFTLLLGADTPPEALVQDHPKRRYFPDIDYTDTDMEQSQMFCHLLVQQMVDAVLNGQIA